MAAPFLKLVAEYIYEHYKDNVENLCIVLPNKRGALFLKQHLAQTFAKTIWLPTIISAEEFISEISELKTIEEIDLMCHLYESYKACYGDNAEPFDSFSKWGQLILQDFNEIDRYLADSEQLYENLKDIKVIENWSLGEENLSEFQLNYLEFMNSLGSIYKHFTTFLLNNKFAYQGLAYKAAVNNISSTHFTGRFHKIL
ncbi:MAG: PD-(D/E)XK nuclease family protein, partial [Bacteroidia bacterium]